MLTNEEIYERGRRDGVASAGAVVALRVKQFQGEQERSPEVNLQRHFMIRTLETLMGHLLLVWAGENPTDVVPALDEVPDAGDG